MTLRVAIFLFPEVEVLDFAGPFEVFTTATRVHGRRNPGSEPPFATVTVAKSMDPVRARAGLLAIPDHAFASLRSTDLLLIPGGVVDREVQDAEVIDWVRRVSKTTKVTASVCTGSFILAKAGLLAGRAATTHWEDLDDLRSQFPDTSVQEAVRWVDEDEIITSAGIAAGIDMSLHLVARFMGRELAQVTARQMDVPYRAEA